MAASDRLDQLVELTGNISNAFTIALYKVNVDNKTLSQLIGASLYETSSKFFPKTTMTL